MLKRSRSRVAGIVAACVLLLASSLGSPANADPPSDTGPNCAAAKAVGLAAVAAQIANAIVVSNAVRHGSQAASFFGSSRSAGTYVVEFAVEDVVALFATRRAACVTKAAVAGALGVSAGINAANTGFPR